MANEKDEVLQANAGSPAADIPDLKKKDKERKKAGAAWSGARGAASEFSGATGGTVSRAAASAAGSMAEGALAEGAAAFGAEGAGGLWATVARFFAGMTSTLLGKIAVAAAAMLLMAAAGLLGYALLKGDGKDGLGSPNLGGIADSMHVRAGGSDRLGVNGNGELRFDPLSAAKPAPAAPVKDATAADEAKPAPDVKADANIPKAMPTGLLAHDMKGTSLSSSLGGDFGGKNIFAGNSNAPKFGAGNGGMPKLGGAKGKLSSMKASTVRGTPSGRSVGKGSANKAFGQLRLAKGLSQQGAGATSAEQAAAASQGAFDQQQPTGGNLNTSGAPGGDTAPSMGGGAPDTSGGSVPSTPPSGGTDPGLQNALSQISQLADKAMSDIQTGTMMAVLGGILIGIGAVLACVLWTCWIGIAIMAAGAALLAAGMAKIDQGKQEAKQAEQMGQDLAKSIGNEQQGNAITFCTQQAIANGTPVEQCNPPDSVTNASRQTSQDDADMARVKQIPVGSAVITQ